MPLNYLTVFCRALKIILVNREIWFHSNLNPKNTTSTGRGAFTTTDTDLYVLVVTLSSFDNAKLLQQLESSFKRKVK